MKSSTYIEELIAGKRIYVPNYQRAYSWETDLKSNNSQKQVNVFLSDLQDYIQSEVQTPYYFGHFLFEEIKSSDNPLQNYAIIDGQQRLTTIIIFLSALYKRLKEIKGTENIKEFDDDLYVAYCNIIKQGSQYKFSTVEYDNQMFRDYVIDQTKQDRNNLDTTSKERIADAFDFFCKELSKLSEEEILSFHKAITKAICSTHVVVDESEAVQMFIFQNNRGKKPTNLEVIKALFMYNVHVYADADEKQSIFETINHRFETIYKSIAGTDDKIDEDNVLNYTVRVYKNTLWGENALEFVENKLKDAEERISFVKDFTQCLASCFEQIITFFKEEKQNMAYHALLQSGISVVLFPYMIKAMRNNMPQEDLNKLANALEQIFLRHRIIGTRAELISRLNDCFKNMNNSAIPIVEHIEWLKSRNDWWGYWGDAELSRIINNRINHDISKILLWKYENHLRQSGKSGYKPLRYDDIETPHLEHIAPQTENGAENNGYCAYDEEFYNTYLNCIGNYLLTSGSHNISIGNIPFKQKRDSYTYLRQQIEIQEMTKEDEIWDKEKIRRRNDKIIEFIKSIL